jgi:Icc-related predicted phosphoesterase
MRFAWITDPHFNHCPLAAWDRLIAQVHACQCDGLIISGDISEGDDVVFQLRRLADAVGLPIHFVLGNHDFYHSSIERTRDAIRIAVAEHPLLNYLTDSAPVSIGGVALIGVDGWGDATVGDYQRSTVRLNDFRLIDDFFLASPSLWKSILRDLGQCSARRLESLLLSANELHKRLLVVTHVPPFRQACWYQGKTTDDNWAPFFVSGQCGDALIDFAQSKPDSTIDVLCGHTHSGGIAKMRDNLIITTAGADYGSPKVAAVIVIANGEVAMEKAAC